MRGLVKHILRLVPGPQLFDKQPHLVGFGIRGWIFDAEIEVIYETLSVVRVKSGGELPFVP
jgi:hypothetical protein